MGWGGQVAGGGVELGGCNGLGGGETSRDLVMLTRYKL